MPSSDRDEAGALDRRRRRCAPTACPTRTVAAMPMPNGTMNRMAVICSAIWCAASAVVLIRPISSAGGAEQAVFQQERDRDRRADDDQLPHQRPVDAPDAPEHVIFPERPAARRQTTGRQERCLKLTIEVARPGAEQLRAAAGPTRRGSAR